MRTREICQISLVAHYLCILQTGQGLKGSYLGGCAGQGLGGTASGKGSRKKAHIFTALWISGGCLCVVVKMCTLYRRRLLSRMFQWASQRRQISTPVPQIRLTLWPRMTQRR